MSQIHARLIFGALLFTATVVDGGTVTSSARIWGWFSSSCLPGENNSGETSASASASCGAAPGWFATSSAISYFNSFADNALTMDLHAYTPLLAGNLYAYGTASWVEEMVVHGGSGSGWVYFTFTGSVLPEGGPGIIGGSSTTTFNGVVEDARFGAIPQQVPFTFDQPFTVSFSIDAFAFADGEMNGALNTQLHWSESLASVTAYTGRPGDPGAVLFVDAQIQLIPEPATWALGIAGGLLLILLRRADNWHRGRCSGTILGIILLTTTTLDAGTVTSSASIWGWFSSSCPPGENNSAETSAPASAFCIVPDGSRAASWVTSQFTSFADNALTMDLEVNTVPVSGNLYAYGTASWVEELVVHGGSGTGWLYFRFTNSASSSDGGLRSCTTRFNGIAEGVGCNTIVESAAFTFDQPLTVALSIDGYALATGAPHPLDSQLRWSVSVANVSAYTGRPGDPLATLIADAQIQLIPEPATWELGIAGGLLLLLLRRGAKKGSPAIPH